MLSRLTLICPTFRRHRFLERSALFWSSRPSVSVMYADGSKEPFSHACVHAQNIRYFHHRGTIQERLQLLLDQVQTPYVCLMGDDEFYIPSALQACVEFLDGHSDYVACMGRAIGFSVANNQVNFCGQYPLLQDRDLDSAFPFERLLNHFSSYVPSHSYAVTRTDVFRHAMLSALVNQIDIFSIGELIYEFLVLAAGKTCVLPELHWLRSHEALPLRNTGDIALDPGKKFDHWWLNEDLSIADERLTFCSELAQATDGAIPPQEVVSIWDGYVKNTYETQVASGARLRNAIIKGFKSAAPETVLHGLKMVRAIGPRVASCLKRPTIQSHAALQELRNQGVTIDEVGLVECVAAIEASLNG